MKVVQKLTKKAQNIYDEKSVTIAFIGDSGTQGCFEVYYTKDNSIRTVYEYNNAYSTRVKEMLNILYPTVQINIINSGISGDCAWLGLKRLQRDVLDFNPDLVVVSFGLNDAVTGLEHGVEDYANALKGIFTACKDSGAECIYLTEWLMNDKVSPALTDERIITLAKRFVEIQSLGILDNYFKRGVEIAKESGVSVCDIYHAWKVMQKEGVDITELLSNKLNHPQREFHYYIAMKLIETMFDM